MFTLLASGLPPVVFALGVAFAPPTVEAPRPPTTSVAAPPKLLVLSRGSTISLQMTSKRPIVRVEMDHEDVIRVVPENPTTLLVTALKTGIVRLTLHDDRGGVETRQFGKPR